MDDKSDAVSQLWVHKDPQSTRMWDFKKHVEQKYNTQITDYEALRQWTIKNIDSFWTEVWHFTGIKSSKPFTKAIENETTMFPRPAFFPGASLNFAENLLYPKSSPAADSLAIIEATEASRANVTWRELRTRVAACTAAMRAHGVSEHDRVAGYLANHTNTLVATLAAASLGAIWTGVSPDTGVHAVLDRLQQIAPKLLFADNAVLYNGKTHATKEKLIEVVAGLPELGAVVVFETVKGAAFAVEEVNVVKGKAVLYEEFLGSATKEETNGVKEQTFAQLPPDHPVYILYSSGTTGKPKCIVHGAIGTLLQHKKEHELHCNILPGDRLFYFTTCTWMMWHWLVSGLASGATLVLYDGSPFRPLSSPLPSSSQSSASSSMPTDGSLAMPALIEEIGITHFGTSAKYLSMLEQKAVQPKTWFPMKSLKAIYSTGSPLAPSTFEYVYDAFGPDINLGSITGGTDIVSLFGAPCPLVPVYKGEIQCLGLGMAVEAWDFTGENVTSKGEPGDLVCRKPFPCQPVGFWGDEDGSRYKGSYFERFEGVWHHGDFIRINPKTGGLVMLGRSDGVLKPSGVRFGSSEIYNVLLKHFAVEVEDALCIGRRRENDDDEKVVLFLKMADGKTLSDDLRTKVKDTIRKELSARHVPAVVDECPEIPVTVNGKKVEVAVKQILCGIKVKTGASVANSECLEWYREWNERN